MHASTGRTRGFLRRSLLRGGALVAAAALVATGCGDDDGGGGAGASGGTVNVGVLVPLTGELGAFGRPWQQAAQLAIEEINASGALPGGAKLKPVLGDEETNPETAVEQARKMISTQDAQLIIGPTSGPMLAIDPIARRARIPVISSSAGTVGLNNKAGEWLFRTVSSDDADGRGLARFMADQGAKEAALLVENDASPISVGQTFTTAFKEAGGTVTTEVKLNPGQSSYRAEVGKIASANPEWVVCACGQHVGTSVVKELAKLGYDGERMLSADLVSPEALKAMGSAGDGAYGGIAESDTDLPAYKNFEEAYREKFGSDPEPFTSNTYDAVMIAGLAMVAADSTKGEDIAKHIIEVSRGPGEKISDFAEAAQAIKEGREVDYDGASGPVDMSDQGTAASSFAIFQAESGDWEQVKFYAAEELQK